MEFKESISLLTNHISILKKVCNDLNIWIEQYADQHIGRVYVADESGQKQPIPEILKVVDKSGKEKQYYMNDEYLFGLGEEISISVNDEVIAKLSPHTTYTMYVSPHIQYAGI